MLDFAIDTEHPVTIKSGSKYLQGLLHIPKHAKGIILFAHGSGSSRFSSRNQFVAGILQTSKFATCLFDLLTEEEEKIDSLTSQYRFDIDFLSSRLVDATHYLEKNPVLKRFPIGYFGASTGAAAAVVAAARLADKIKAVVSRGGRPDLAGESLNYIKAPTLLLVGSLDTVVIDLNKKAHDQMNCVKDLTIVPGASHLFEEPGTLDIVSNLAKDWFDKFI